MLQHWIALLKEKMLKHIHLFNNAYMHCEKRHIDVYKEYL